MDKRTSKPKITGVHGSPQLTSVEIDSYNIEARDEDGFVGDRASKGAFRTILESYRATARKRGGDPFGDIASDDITKKQLDKILTDGDSAAAGILHGVIEDFSQELAKIIRRFLKTKGWRDTQRIVVGGGFRDSRVGEIAIGRAEALLREEDVDVEVRPVHNDPNEAALIGAVHLAPAWVFHGFDAILAVDIGGTNIRAGIVRLNLKKSRELVRAEVMTFEIWRHAEEDKLKREDAVEELIEMLRNMIKIAKKEGVELAPFIGIGCPGRIDSNGAIENGAQNLPGNWESSRFNLPQNLCEAIPEIGQHETVVVMHNDAVVQGLSEMPFMQDVEHWGVLTIGTGLGNARYTNRKGGKPQMAQKDVEPEPARNSKP